MALVTAGCAGHTRARPAIETTELADVPFFPQTEYQCGPAALATILANEQIAVDADDLAPAVYVAGLQGSLQPELLGATRRHGLIPYVLAANTASLFAELDAGRPVLVLQNLGLKRFPVWHYAVVVGFDRDADRVVLRSGTEKRRLERTNRFLRSWGLGDNWAFIALRPGELPATATPERYVRALAGAERLLADTDSRAAYAAALARWPNDELALFAAAGYDHGRRRLEAAVALYRRLLAQAPDHAAARNNLANILAEQGCHEHALREARSALARVEPDGVLHDAIRDTVASLERSSPSSSAPTRGSRCP
jgi:tetratricopeptide (TPR) repeat protein